jgi:hypothetical protein
LRQFRSILLKGTLTLWGGDGGVKGGMEEIRFRTADFGLRIVTHAVHLTGEWLTISSVAQKKWFD